LVRQPLEILVEPDRFEVRALEGGQRIRNAIAIVRGPLMPSMQTPRDHLLRKRQEDREAPERGSSLSLKFTEGTAARIGVVDQVPLSKVPIEPLEHRRLRRSDIDIRYLIGRPQRLQPFLEFLAADPSAGGRILAKLFDGLDVDVERVAEEPAARR